MLRMLMCFDGPVVKHMSQMVPLARCFESEYTLDCMVLNSVTYQFVDHLPFIDHIVPLKYQDGEVRKLTEEEGRIASTDYYYSDPRTSLEDLKQGKLSADVEGIFESYDKILLLYDDNYDPIRGMFDLFLKRFEHKCFGRVGSHWRRDVDVHQPDRYTPQDAVVSFGFPYHDDLLKVELDWYKEFDPHLEIQSKSVCVTTRGLCETYIPDSNDRTYPHRDELIKALEDKGFQVVPTNNKETIRRQVFYSQCTYHIGVESPTTWFYQCFKPARRNIFLLQPTKFPYMEERLGVRALDAEQPEEIAEKFLSQLRNRL